MLDDAGPLVVAVVQGIVLVVLVALAAASGRRQAQRGAARQGAARQRALRLPQPRMAEPETVIDLRDAEVPSHS